jgi:DNA-directed RNA polymerase specialized sigma24 family protein
VRCYLLKSIRNRIVDEVRRAEWVARLDERHPASALDDAASPLEEAIETEERRIYRELLLKLGEDERLLVVGRVDLNLSYHQLAIATGRPSADAARVASRRAILVLARAVGRLRDVRR